MRVLLVANYYQPETVGAGIWITQLAKDLKALGHDVTVVTSYPSYPHGKIFDGYRNRFASREFVDGIEVIRTFTYATPNKNFWPRLAAFGTFCLSSIFGYWRWRRRVDVVYALLPPLPLGISGWVIAKASRARLAINVQDIYPDIAVALNFLRNPVAIAFFQRLERWIYRHSDRIVVISEGFRQNLLAKGVEPAKIHVVPNWADPDQITPQASDNRFRRETGANRELLVLYSGGLTHNAELDQVLEAASELRGLPVRFAIVGEGVRKEALIEKARTLALGNVNFFPFQPIERYGEVLAAADVTLVTLNSASTFASVPSKVYKQMAAARPIIAITNSGNELARLITESQCGATVPPGDTQCLVAVLKECLENRRSYADMGRRGRSYLEHHCSRSRCVADIARALETASNRLAYPISLSESSFS